MTLAVETYARQRRYERRKSAEKSEIPPISGVVDQSRRDAGECDLHFFLRTYFPASTGLKPFSSAHERAIFRIQSCAISGGRYGNFFPRGYGKSSISEGAAIWATLYAHRRFAILFGANEAKATEAIKSIQGELLGNDLLLEDFPEVCCAFRHLNGTAQAAHSQSYEGDKTHIGWRANEIVFPTMAGALSGGAILLAHGIDSASRGTKHKRPDGTQQRPDFVILDDPQTDESASSPTQTETRLNLIRKTILKLGGHDQEIACVINANVIQAGDLAEQLCNKKQFPGWQIERIKMVQKWADAHESFWLGEYKQTREAFDDTLLGDQERAWHDAAELYRSKRVIADAGCVVTWEDCPIHKNEISSIQHAYNLLIDDGEEVFASECQNEPLEEKVDDDALRLRCDDVAGKINGMARGALPVEASRLIAFIDPKKELLYWTVVAFADGFTGYVVDYGTFPDQRKPYFSSRKPRYTLTRATNADSWEAILYAGLDALVGQLAGREWKRDDGAMLKLERIAIDANWGEATDTIYLFCRQSPNAALLLPTHGKYHGARGRPFGEYTPKPGDRTGVGWRMPAVGNRRAVRYAVFDTNFFKTFTTNRLKTPMGGRGCLTLFKAKPDEHRLFGDHVVSERPIVVEANGRRVVEWEQNKLVDNDYFDCLVGCHVTASIQGVSLHEKREQAARKTVTFAERKKERKVWRANRA